MMHTKRLGSSCPIVSAIALRSTSLSLSPADVERIAAAIPPEQVAGTRYGSAQMAELDSERA